MFGEEGKFVHGSVLSCGHRLTRDIDGASTLLSSSLVHSALRQEERTTFYPWPLFLPLWVLVLEVQIILNLWLILYSCHPRQFTR